MPLPQTEIPGRLQALLAERGIRMTDQRGAILSMIEIWTQAKSCESPEGRCLCRPWHGVSGARIIEAAGFD
jgi:hypothetical protein